MNNQFLVVSSWTITYKNLHPPYNNYHVVSTSRRGVASISFGKHEDPMVVHKSTKSSSNACGNGIVRKKCLTLVIGMHTNGSSFGCNLKK
jgi:hypothetical protein